MPTTYLRRTCYHIPPFPILPDNRAFYGSFHHPERCSSWHHTKFVLRFLLLGDAILPLNVSLLPGFATRAFRSKAQHTITAACPDAVLPTAPRFVRCGWYYTVSSSPFCRQAVILIRCTTHLPDHGSATAYRSFAHHHHHTFSRAFCSSRNAVGYAIHHRTCLHVYVLYLRHFYLPMFGIFFYRSPTGRLF